MAEKVTLGLNDETKAGFDSLRKNIESTATTAAEAATKTALLNKELESRAVSKMAADMKDAADEIDGTAQALASLKEKFGLTTQEAKKLQAELDKRGEEQAARDLKKLADQADGTAAKIQELGNKYGLTQEKAEALHRELQDRAMSRAKTEAKEYADELDHVARSADKAGEFQKQLRKEMQARKDEATKKSVKKAADKEERAASWKGKSVGGKAVSVAQGAGGIARKSLGFVGSGAANAKAALDMVVQAAQKVGQAINALADRGVPAFEKLVGVGAKFQEELFKIGESHEVQELVSQISDASSEVMMPVLKQLTGATAFWWSTAQRGVSEFSRSIQTGGAMLGIFSQDYIEALNDEVAAEEVAKNKRKEIRDKENAERAATRKRLKEEAEEDLRNPGKKMNEEERFNMGLQANDESQVTDRIALQKKKMAEKEAALKANDPTKDISKDADYMKMQAELVKMESRMMELKRMAKELAGSLISQGNANDDVETRMKDLKTDGKMFGGDAELSKARDTREAADQEVLGNMVGPDQDKEFDRQVAQQKAEIEAYNKQIEARKERDLATGKELATDEELNKTVEERNELEERLNKKLIERARILKQLNAEKEERGEKPTNTTDYEDDAQKRKEAARQRNRAFQTTVKEDSEKQAEAAAKAAKDNAAAPAAGPAATPKPDVAPMMPGGPPVPFVGGGGGFMGPDQPGVANPFAALSDGAAQPPPQMNPRQQKAMQIQQARQQKAMQIQADRKAAIDKANQIADQREQEALVKKGDGASFTPAEKQANLRLRKKEQAKALSDSRKSRASQGDLARQQAARARAQEREEKKAKSKLKPVSAKDKAKQKKGVVSDEVSEEQRAAAARNRINADDSGDEQTLTDRQAADMKETQANDLAKNKDKDPRNLGYEQEIKKLEAEVKELRKRADQKDEQKKHGSQKPSEDPFDMSSDPFPNDDVDRAAMDAGAFGGKSKPVDEAAEERRKAAEQENAGKPSLKDQLAANPFMADTPNAGPKDSQEGPDPTDVTGAIKDAADAAGGAGKFSNAVTQSIKTLGDQVVSLTDQQAQQAEQLQTVQDNIGQANDRASTAGSRARNAGSSK